MDVEVCNEFKGPLSVNLNVNGPETVKVTEKKFTL